MAYGTEQFGRSGTLNPHSVEGPVDEDQRHQQEDRRQRVAQAGPPLGGQAHRELHREVAEELGMARPEVDEKIEGEHASPWKLAGRSGELELAADRFLDGARFDPRAVADALRACAVHALRVPLDELEAAQRPRG